MTAIYDSGYVPAGITVRTTPPTPRPASPIPVTGTLLAERNPAGNKSHNWMAVDWQDDYSAAGDNCARYIKQNRMGQAHAWSLCCETRDVSGAAGSVYAAEFDICSDRVGGDVFGVATFYGAQTATFGPGAATVADCAYKAAPFVYGRNSVLAGYRFEGHADEGALSVGVHGSSTTRHAVNMGPGVTLRWSSGTGKAHPTAWRSFSRSYKPAELSYVGCVAIEVDGTTLWLPVLGAPPE